MLGEIGGGCWAVWLLCDSVMAVSPSLQQVPAVQPCFGSYAGTDPCQPTALMPFMVCRCFGVLFLWVSWVSCTHVASADLLVVSSERRVFACKRSLWVCSVCCWLIRFQVAGIVHRTLSSRIFLCDGGHMLSGNALHGQGRASIPYSRVRCI